MTDDDKERREDQDSRDRLSDVQASYERFSALVWRAIIVLAVVLVGSLAVQGWLIRENRHRANTSQHNSERIDESFRRALYIACRETNQRHEDTVEALDNQIALIEDPQVRERATVNRQVTVSLIEALAPLRDDCHAYVARLLTGG